MTLFRRTVCLLLLFIFLSSASSAAAQSEDTPPIPIEPLTRFEQLTAADGLASNSVLSSHQDSRGFLWFGTENGLSRYDGYTIKTYKHDPDNPNSLVHDVVRQIVEDEDGVLWLTTADGLSQFDPDTDTFTTLALDFANARSRRRTNFFASLIDSHGNHWFGGSVEAGLIRFRPNQNELVQFPLIPPGRVATGDELFPGGTVQAMLETDDGIVWFAASEQLVKYDAATDRFQHYPLPAEQGIMISLTSDDNNQIWVGSLGGLYRFDTREESFHHYEQFAQTNVFHVSDGGLLWLSTPEWGLVAFDTHSETVVEQYQHQIEWGDSIADNWVETLTVDQYGIFWLGTSNGVSRLDPQHAQFNWFGYTPAGNSTLPNPDVTAVHALSDEDWSVVSADLFTQFDLETSTVDQLAPLATLDGSLDAVFQEANGDIWLGNGDQLLQVDVETRQITPMSMPPPHPDARMALAADVPFAVSGIEKAKDGTLWVSVFGLGLLQIEPDRESSKWTPVARVSEGQPNSVGENITVMRGGADGLLWLGYQPPILTRYNTADGSARHYVLSNGTGLGGNFGAADIYEDLTGTVWVATNYGLLQLDPSSGNVVRIEAFASEPLMSVIGDRGGGLWVASEHGLYRYRLDNGDVTQFTLEDGLPSVNFNPAAAAITPSGRLLFGTDNGLVAFYAEEIRPKPAPAPPIITDIQLFNESIPIDGTILNRAVWETEQLTLAYNQNALSFEFSAGSYPNFDNLRYRYRLNGLEETWTEVGSARRYVTFGQLPPGEYMLELQSGTQSGGWNETSTTIGVTLVPAWWQRTAVRIGAIVLLFGMVAYGLWQRSVRLKRRNDELTELVADQTRDLVDSEARFRSIAGASFEAILVYDNGTIIDANAVAADLFGIPHDQLVGRTIEQLGVNGTLIQHLTSENEDVWEVETTTLAGRTLIIEGRSDSMPYRGHTAQVAALRDVTERRKLEEERQHMATLEERERIGRDLHDDLGQMMGYLNIQAQTAQQQLNAAQTDSASAILQQLADVSREAHNNIRRYILGIRAEETAGETVNLREALQLLAQRMRERHALDVTLTLPTNLNTLGLADEVEAQLLRIVQESLTNIVKHAETDRAHVFMTIEEKQVRVVIADEGRGFAAEQPLDGHYGLQIMRERAVSVNGSLAVESVEGQGTQVVALLPHLKARNSAETIRNIRTLVVDDHPLYLEGLTSLLATRGVNVIGTARNGKEAETVAKQLKPALILMDIDMPERDGLEATRRIHEALPDTKIVMLTVAADEERLLAALRRGASGYLLKSLDGERFFAALADVMQGETVLSPSIASRVLADIAKGESKAKVVFTSRQQDVLRLVAQGLSNKEISEELYISIHTVKYHVHKILDLLHLENRHQLTLYAKETGLVQ